MAWILLATTPLMAYAAYAVFDTNQIYYDINVSSPTIATGAQPTPLLAGGWNNATVTVTTAQAFSGRLHLQIFNQTGGTPPEGGANPGAVTVYIDGQLMAPFGSYASYYITQYKPVSNGTTFVYNIHFNLPAPYRVRLMVTSQ